MADNYISTNMESGIKVKEALARIESYEPDLFVWNEISDSVTINLKSPTTYSGIKDPGDYVIYKFSNGPASIPSTLAPILLSLRNGKICVTANDQSFIFDSSNDNWNNINETYSDDMIVYIKSDIAPDRTSNTFWFDTSKFDGTDDSFIDLKYYNETTKAWESVFGNDTYLKKSVIDPNGKGEDIFKYITNQVATMVGDYGEFLKHIDNQLTLIHVSATDREKYAKIITASELQELIMNTYKPALKSAVDKTVNSELDTTELVANVTSLSSELDEHINGKLVDNTTMSGWIEANTGTYGGYDSICHISNNTFYAISHNDYVDGASKVCALQIIQVANDTLVYAHYHFGTNFYPQYIYNANNPVVIGCDTSYASMIYVYSNSVTNWNAQEVPNIGILNRGYYLNGMHIILSQSTTSSYLYSTDGITWTKGTMPSEQSWRAVCYGNGKFVAIAYNTNVFAYSTDGINWTQDTMPNKDYWYDICYCNNGFIAIAFGSIHVGYSEDGINWFGGIMPNNASWVSICYNPIINKSVAISTDSKLYACLELFKNEEGMPGLSYTKGEISDTARSWQQVCCNDDITIIINNTSSKCAYCPNQILSDIHVTADDIARWENKAEKNHTHDYTSGSTTLSASQITSGTFTPDQLPDEIKERYYKITADTPDAEFSNTSITAADRSSKYHNGNGFYFPVTDSYGNATYRWFRIIDSSKVGTSDWASGVTEFTASEANLDWSTISGRPNTIEEFGIENDMMTKTQFDNIYNGLEKTVSEMDTNTDNLGGEVSFEFESLNNNWTEGTMPSKQQWISVCYGNDKFVASIDEQTDVFAYSTDGINWTQGNMPSTQYWQSVCYGNGKFVAVAPYSDVFAYSTDGINWTSGNMPSSESWASVCYGNDKFVAVSQWSNVFVYSTDGITWTSGNMPSRQTWYSVCYGNGKFVAVTLDSNNIYAYSSDGITWTQGNMPSSISWRSVCYGNGKFVAVANSDVFAYSTDGINWTSGNMPSSQYWAICYGNGKFVATSDGSNAFAYSTDGITWTQGTLPSSSYWHFACYGNGKFVAVAAGSNVFAYAPDTLGDPSISIENIGFQIRKDSTTFNDNATGSIPQIDAIIRTSDGKIYKSTQNLNSTYEDFNGNKTTTENASEPLGASMTEVFLKEFIEESISTDTKSYFSMAYGNNAYVAVANWNDGNADYITISKSTDGANWIDEYQSAGIATDVVFDGSKFVIVYYILDQYDIFAARVLTSTNGTDWVDNAEIGSLKEWTTLAYGNGKFITMSKDGYVATSTNATTWTLNNTQVITQFANDPIIRMKYVNNEFFFITNYNYFGYSTDGITWTKDKAPDGSNGYCGPFVINDTLCFINKNTGEVCNPIAIGIMSISELKLDGVKLPIIQVIADPFHALFTALDSSTTLGLFMKDTNGNYIIGKSNKGYSFTTLYEFNSKIVPLDMIYNNDQLVIIGGNNVVITTN